ncbi:hypothetical protein MTO96_023519 [Rhipicephalus appendiculatus]
MANSALLLGLRNLRVNTACNVSVGMCVAPIILAVIVLSAIEYQRYALEKARQQRARAKLESAKSANSSAGDATHESGKASTQGWVPPVHDDLVFPPEAVLAGVLFNRRRFFFGRSLDSHQGPCVVAAPQRRCLMVWQGMPPRFEDDFEYLAHSAGVTFSWTSRQAGHPWPSNAVRLTAYTTSSGTSSLLAGVVRLSESSKLIVIDNQRVRLFPQYELLVALIFEFLVESRGVVFEWVDFRGDGGAKGNASDELSGSPSSPDLAEVTVGGVLVGRSRPLPPDGRLLLGAVVRVNASRLYACDVREPLPAPLDTFQVLVKRPAGTELRLH